MILSDLVEKDGKVRKASPDVVELLLVEDVAVSEGLSSLGDGAMAIFYGRGPGTEGWEWYGRRLGSVSVLRSS